MGRLKLLLCSVALSTVAATSHAQLLLGDWKVQGDGLVAVDVVNDLEWLNIGQTVDISYNDMLTRFGAGGTFEGWRYASYAELDLLYVELGIAQYGGGGFPLQSAFDNVRNAQEFIGFTQYMNDFHSERWLTFGMVATSSADYVQYRYFEAIHRKPGQCLFDNPGLCYGASFSNDVNFDSSNGPSRDKHFASRGSFLVRDLGSGGPVAAIPEPETYAMLLAGLAILGFAHRKRTPAVA